MDIIILGQFLLGFLTLVALAVNMQLVRLGRRFRARHVPLTPFLALLLLWLPVVALVVVAGGAALGETSLLTYRAGQDASGLDWFVVGASLAIFANLCAAMTWITLREALKGTDTL
jgi:hypothetical protein